MCQCFKIILSIIIFNIYSTINIYSEENSYVNLVTNYFEDFGYKKEDVKEIMELHVIDRNFLIVSIHHEWYGEKLYNIYLLYYDKELQIITKYLEIAFGHIQDDEKYNTIMDSVPGTHFGREFLSIIDFNGDGIDDIISFYIYDRSDNYFFAIYSLGETVAFIENQVAFGVKDNYEMPPVVFHQENGRMHYEVLFPPGPDYSR